MEARLQQELDSHRRWQGLMDAWKALKKEYLVQDFRSVAAHTAEALPPHPTLCPHQRGSVSRVRSPFLCHYFKMRLLFLMGKVIGAFFFP